MASLANAIVQQLWSRPAGRRLLESIRESGPLRNWVQRGSGHRVPYADFASARAAKARKPIGYEHCAPDIYTGLTATLIPGDYPAMFWLQQILPTVNWLFDYGGNMGLQFYSYSRLMQIPAGLTWTVCDIDPFVTEGTRMAAEKQIEQLKFCYHLAEGSGAEVFLVSGSLHYLESPFAGELKKLDLMPKHLLINRVPLSEGPDTVTLQDIGSVLLPVVIRNRPEFVQSVVAVGYELCDEWDVPGLQCVLPLYPERSAFSYRGFYFRRRP